MRISPAWGKRIRISSYAMIACRTVRRRTLVGQTREGAQLPPDFLRMADAPRLTIRTMSPDSPHTRW